MSWVEILCRKRTCHGRFKVDESIDKRECHDCGTVHYAPWHSPIADTSDREIEDPRSSPRGFGELECKRCGEEFDSDRDPVVVGQNVHRCPACGHDNTVRRPDTVEDTAPASAPATSGGGLASQLGELDLDDVAGGGDVHIHLHNDG